MFLSALAAGFLAGAVILFLAHIAPFFGAGNFIRDLDSPHVFGKKVTHREAHLTGILVHLLVSGGFGVLFAYFISLGWFNGFSLPNILAWSFILALFNGGIVFPLEGHGIFGVKEDSWFPVDLFLTSFAWGVLFWFMMRLWFAAV